MSERRKDTKGRNLRDGETVMPDGRYRFRYTDPAGNRKAVYSWKLVPTDRIPAGKKECLSLRELEDQIHYDKHDGIDSFRADQLTLNQLFDEYMATKHDLKISTRSMREYMYNRFVRDRIGKKKIVQIKFSTVKRYYSKLLNVDGLKANTIDTIHTLLFPAFALAVRDGYIRMNPADGAMVDIKKSDSWSKEKRHALTVEQQAAFVKHTAESYQYNHWLPVITFLLGTGCRVGEMIGLTWQDCDFENETISINHNVMYRSVDGEMRLIISTPKTKSSCRTIPMLPEVKETLLKIRKDQMLNGCNNIVLDGYSGFVFRNTHDELFHNSSINRGLERIRKEYNAIEAQAAQEEQREPLLIPHFSVHSLRHTFCTRFCENESNVKVIQSVMGHSNIQTTLNIYAEVTEDKKQEVFRNLEGKMKIS